MELSVSNSYIPMYRTNNLFISHPQGKTYENKGFDSVKFTGKSLPSLYHSTFDFMASEIFSRNKRYQIDGSLLSASKITQAIKKVFDDNSLFSFYPEADVQKIKWKNYIPEDIREFSINKINDARSGEIFLKIPKNGEILIPSILNW